MVHAGQEVVIVGGSHALHRHEKLAIAVSKAMRGHSLQETKTDGRFHVHTKTYLDGAVLREVGTFFLLLLTCIAYWVMICIHLLYSSGTCSLVIHLWSFVFLVIFFLGNNWRVKIFISRIFYSWVICNANHCTICFDQ